MAIGLKTNGCHYSYSLPMRHGALERPNSWNPLEIIYHGIYISIYINDDYVNA